MVLDELARIVTESPVKVEMIQISSFPGIRPEDEKELFSGLTQLRLELQTIIMVVE